LKVKKRRGVYEVTLWQIIAAMLIATFTLTIVFFIGVYVGKNRVINAERESQELNETILLSKLKDNIENIDSSKVTANLKEKSQDAVNSVVKRLNAPTGKQNANQAKQENDGSINTTQTAKTNEEPLSSVAQSSTIDKPEVPKGLKYTVKVGTFSSIENAKKLFDSLKSSGYEPQLIKESNQGKTLCHVTIGDFDSIDKAKQYGDELREKLPYINDFVIRNR